jgi:hypothetical protein
MRGECAEPAQPEHSVLPSPYLVSSSANYPFAVYTTLHERKTRTLEVFCRHEINGAIVDYIRPGHLHPPA